MLLGGLIIEIVAVVLVIIMLIVFLTADQNAGAIGMYVAGGVAGAGLIVIAVAELLWYLTKRAEKK